MAEKTAIPGCHVLEVAGSASERRKMFPRGILVVNDDGPPGKHAPFLLPFVCALVKQIETLAPKKRPKVLVCTPAAQQSWVAKAICRFDHLRALCSWLIPDLHAPKQPQDVPNTPTPSATAAAGGGGKFGVATASGPLGSLSDLSHWIQESHVEGWALVGSTPASTCNVAMHNLASTMNPPFPVDLVISGPNYGRNSGRAYALSSGTVGAALEACISHKRAISLSFGYRAHNNGSFTRETLQTSSAKAAAVIFKLLNNWSPNVELYNVNIPVNSTMQTPVYSVPLFQPGYGPLYAFREHSKKLLAETESKEAEKEKGFAGEVELEFAGNFNFGETVDPKFMKGTDMWCATHHLCSVTPLRASLAVVRTKTNQLDSEVLFSAPPDAGV